MKARATQFPLQRTPFKKVSSSQSDCRREEIKWNTEQIDCQSQFDFDFRTDDRVEEGSNTSTVTLRVVRGDEKGSVKSETVKYSREFQGTQTQERVRWLGPAAYTKDRPVLSSERMPNKNKIVTVKQQ
jgi:hypothetical protein